MKLIALNALAFSLILVAGCQSTSEFQYTGGQIGNVRARILDKYPWLDGASKDIIQTNAPKIDNTIVPHGVSIFTYSWTISSNRVVALRVVHSSYMWWKRENASVSISQNPGD